MAAPYGRFEPAPWCIQARRLPSNEPGFARVRPTRLIGLAFRATSTVLGARLRRLCTRPCGHHLETFLARAAESDPMGYGLPDCVERDLRGYLECGILAHGFATTLRVVPPGVRAAGTSG